MVTAKTSKRCHDPADQAGSVVNAVEARPVRLKEHPPKAWRDVSGSQFREFFHCKLLDLFLTLGKKAAPFLVFIYGHMWENRNFWNFVNLAKSIA